MKPIGDIMFPGGTYMKDNEEKTRWIRCGTLFRNAEGKQAIKLDAIPVGIEKDGGWFQVFEKSAKPQAAQPKLDEDVDW